MNLACNTQGEARQNYKFWQASDTSTFGETEMREKKLSKDTLVAQEIPDNPRFIDRTGQRFGRLVVLSYAGKQNKQSLWNCLCDCGNTSCVYGCRLVVGATTSCGCRRKEAASKAHRSHGDSSSRQYGVWSMMLGRCYNPNASEYGNYGARGIVVAEEFKTWVGYRDWVENNLGPKPFASSSIDRINVNGNYAPGNLRWASSQQQARNRRNTVYSSATGKTITLAEEAEITGVCYSTLYSRIRRSSKAVQPN